MSILTSIGKFFVGALIAVGIIATPSIPVTTPAPVSPTLGAAITQGGALYDGFLASGIATNATTMTLTSGAFKDGTSLSGWNCFTVDANSPSIEYICGNASGTVVSNLMRGVGLVNPNTTSTALTFYHGRGASVQITDYPDLQILKRIVNGTDPVPNALSYDPSVTSSTLAGNPQNLASVAYANGISAAGAPNASVSVKGIVQEPTSAQVASGTNVGSTGADLAIPNRYASRIASTSVTVVIASGTTGGIDASYLAGGNYSVAQITVTGTSSIPYLVPLGTLEAYVSSTAPAGWLLANGQMVATATYPSLFTLIGYTYGGSTSTFGVPNLGGRFLTGPSSTFSMTVGASGGSINGTSTANITAQSIGGTTQTSGNGGGGSLGYDWASFATNTVYTVNGSSTVIPPYFVVNYIIKY